MGQAPHGTFDMHHSDVRHPDGGGADVGRQHRGPVPRGDPSFQIVSVPASKRHVGEGVKAISLTEMLKFVRIYMPRSSDPIRT